MRRLLYVPILHDEADLGSLGPTLSQRSAALSGERRWAMHREIVRRFWEGVASYLRSFDPSQLRLYQDGLAADGEMGRRIVEEAAQRGSQNYQLLRELLNRGAKLQKTEDAALLLREHQNAVRLAGQGPAAEGGAASAHRHQRQRDALMEERDRFIAQAINATLKEGDLGALFMGARHDVPSHLAADISVERLKEPEKVEAYLEELLLGHDDRRLEELGQYVSSPIRAS